MLCWRPARWRATSAAVPGRDSHESRQPDGSDIEWWFDVSHTLSPGRGERLRC
jgi:hypothetical protein